MRRPYRMLAPMLVLVLFCACSSPLKPDELAQKVFGTPKKAEDSGVDSLNYSEGDLVIQYRFFPVGISSFEEELGILLAPKLQRMYKDSKEVDDITVLALGPFHDKLGNITWKPMLSFTVDRKLITQDIQWDTFLKKNLVSVSKDVERFR